MVRVRVRRRVQLAWHCRRQPRWADRWHIVGRFIATGAMVLGPVDPLAAQEILPVVRFSVRVVVHETPEYLPLL